MLETEFAITTDKGIPLQLRIQPNKNSHPEAYVLKIQKNRIDIEASAEQVFSMVYRA